MGGQRELQHWLAFPLKLLKQECPVHLESVLLAIPVSGGAQEHPTMLHNQAWWTRVWDVTLFCFLLQIWSQELLNHPMNPIRTWTWQIVIAVTFSLMRRVSQVLLLLINYRMVKVALNAPLNPCLSDSLIWLERGERSQRDFEAWHPHQGGGPDILVQSGKSW